MEHQGVPLLFEYQFPNTSERKNVDTIFGTGGYTFKFDRETKLDVYNNVYYFDEEKSKREYVKGPRHETGLTFEEVIDLPWG